MILLDLKQQQQRTGEHCLASQCHPVTHSPAMLGFLVQAGWPLAGGGFSSCSSMMLDVWLCGGSGSPLHPDVMSLASAKLLRNAARRCNRTAQSTTVGQSFLEYKTYINTHVTNMQVIMKNMSDLYFITIHNCKHWLRRRVLTEEEDTPHGYRHQDTHGQLDGRVAHLRQLAVLSFEPRGTGAHVTCVTDDCYYGSAFW